ncbi:hypothetical protein [Okeania sp. SIO2B9]|nr:hypothetical protein [Okeania sp. SIO2B9]NET80114.1 hypothetical protein [Okeania sp. SIO1F9]
MSWVRYVSEKAQKIGFSWHIICRKNPELKESEYFSESSKSDRPYFTIF